MYILGISAYYHDSSACLICDGEIIAAAQEERFSRVKHDSNFPVNAIKYCIASANIKPEIIKNVVFYDKPFLKFERILETYLAFAPLGFFSFISSLPVWVKDKLFQKNNIIKSLQNNIDQNINWDEKLIFSEHHLSHAASAFFPSPFNEAAILTMDGVGEWTTTSLSIGENNKIEILKEIHFPHSIGLLYSAFTYYLGFKVNSGEYKVMGLAPYGTPKYVDVIKDKLVDIKNDGSFHLDLSYFDYCTDLKMTSKKFTKLFNKQPRFPETEITQKDMDIASSIQKVTEEIVLKMAKNIAKETGLKNLCLAGGVALNCVCNGILVKENIFENIWVQPASGDAGGSLGAALATYYMIYNKQRLILNNKDGMKGSYLGPIFNSNDIKKSLNKLNAVYKEFNDSQLINETAKYLSNKKFVGWFSGRMEFGPRALGSRSILADPQLPEVQKKLNLKIKFRESFRPFAPSILSEKANEWFNITKDSPYMLFVSEVADTKKIHNIKNDIEITGFKNLDVVKSKIPAVTHVDYSSRIQTVHKETNPKYHSLIKKFFEMTGCPILVNTSFNVRGEPIVCSVNDAFDCFMKTELDILVIENFILVKEDQIIPTIQKPIDNYELD